VRTHARTHELMTNDARLVVKENLMYQHLWEDVQEEGELLTGTPRIPLYAGEENRKEYVVSTYVDQKWSLDKIARVMDSIPARDDKRMVLAMIGSDSSVVYYIVNDGLRKPRRN
jgi:hypothetical protein